jgi:hypothetical protein
VEVAKTMTRDELLAMLDDAHDIIEHYRMHAEQEMWPRAHPREQTWLEVYRNELTQRTHSRGRKSRAGSGR